MTGCFESLLKQMLLPLPSQNVSWVLSFVASSFSNNLVINVRSYILYDIFMLCLWVGTPWPLADKSNVSNLTTFLSSMEECRRTIVLSFVKE